MKARAVIFDIYNTLLKVGPPPLDTSKGWETAWRDVSGSPSSVSLDAFALRCKAAIQESHHRSLSRGICCPEVFWPEIVRSVLPEVSGWDDAKLDRFLFRHAQLQRTVTFEPAAAATLKALAKAGCCMGLCSNCQPYTLHELREALEGTGCGLDLFDASLRFLSFEAGFSKPNPEAFRRLQAALAEKSVAPSETLMVGDRLDNDIEPARALGWQTWQLAETQPLQSRGGGWEALLDWLGESGSV